MIELIVVVSIFGTLFCARKGLKKLSSHLLNKEIKKVIMKKTFKSNSEEICVICQDDYKTVHKCAELFCGHKYHKKCLMKWLCEKPTCPLCNTGLLLRSGKHIQRLN